VDWEYLPAILSAKTKLFVHIMGSLSGTKPSILKMIQLYR